MKKADKKIGVFTKKLIKKKKWKTKNNQRTGLN